MKIVALICCAILSFPSMRIATQFQTAEGTQDWKLAKCSDLKITYGADFSDAMQRSSVLSATSHCMSKENSDISISMLDEDKAVIEHSYPQVKEFYLSRKYSQADLSRIIPLAWTEFRAKHPSKQMSSPMFIQLSNSFGQLIVESEPAGATISVDARSWDGTTNNRDWTDSGERLVKLMKLGCQTVEGKVTVPAGGTATFKRKLACS